MNQHPQTHILYDHQTENKTKERFWKSWFQRKENDSARKQTEAHSDKQLTTSRASKEVAKERKTAIRQKKGSEKCEKMLAI